MLKKVNYTKVFLVSCLEIFLQIDSTWNQKPEINIIGFVDVYFVYYFNKTIRKCKDFFLITIGTLNLSSVTFLLRSLDHQKYRMFLELHV
jgi:hypothetical protein